MSIKKILIFISKSKFQIVWFSHVYLVVDEYNLKKSLKFTMSTVNKNFGILESC
jgi:hypothetical protein